MIEQNRYTKSEIFAWPFRTNNWLFRVNIPIVSFFVVLSIQEGNTKTQKVEMAASGFHGNRKYKCEIFT